MLPPKINIEDWTKSLLAKGKHVFSYADIAKSFKHKTKIAIISALNRLVVKGMVVSIFKEYYLIIPPQYGSKGMLPPVLFIDDLMKHLQRNYYVGLLSAAAYQGASHQQAQEFFVVTTAPFLRTKIKNGIKINYIITTHLPSEKNIEQLKTETGYVNISNPFLTALDVIKYQKHVGGLTRAIEVLNELQPSIQQKHICNDLIKNYPVVIIQRLGFILGEILVNKKLADKILLVCKKNNLRFVQVQLNPSLQKNTNFNATWNVAENIKIHVNE